MDKSNSEKLDARDMAIKIMTEKIGYKTNLRLTSKDETEIAKLESEIAVLLEERKAMYKGNAKVIKKILDVYAHEIK